MKLSQGMVNLIKRLQIISRKEVSAVLGGEYRSVFRGKGIEFEELREYVPGDDVKTVEWRTTARKGNLYVKKFREERELTVILLVDVSPSMMWGKGTTRWEKAAEAAAILSLAALYNKDRVGLFTFSTGRGKFVPPRKGRSHFLVVLRSLFEPVEQRGRTDIASALRWFNAVMRKRVIAFLISDFACPLNFNRELLAAASRHDFIGVWVRDSAEQELLQAGPWLLSDMEDSHQRFLWLRKGEVKQKLEQHWAHLRRLFIESGAELIEIDTCEPAIRPIELFFRRRLRR